MSRRRYVTALRSLTMSRRPYVTTLHSLTMSLPCIVSLCHSVLMSLPCIVSLCHAVLLTLPCLTDEGIVTYYLRSSALLIFRMSTYEYLMLKYLGAVLKECMCQL